MANDRLAGLLLDAFTDTDRALEGVTEEEAVRQWDGGSSFAWTLGHVTEGVDNWINVRFQGHVAHSVIGGPRFRFGGTGVAEDWDAIREAVREVRDSARPFLLSLEKDADRVIPYDGSFFELRETGLSLQYALIRLATHHYVHVGWISAQRSRLGYRVDLPGAMEECFSGRYP